MRRNQDVPAKYFPPALHRRGVSKPLSHYSLSASNSFSCFWFKRLQKYLPIKKNCFSYFQISGNLGLILINPFFRHSQQLGNFFNFNSEWLGGHNNSIPQTTYFILSQLTTTTNFDHYFFHKRI